MLLELLIYTRRLPYQFIVKAAWWILQTKENKKEYDI
jgi:hypothetical protein